MSIPSPTIDTGTFPISIALTSFIEDVLESDEPLDVAAALYDLRQFKIEVGEAYDRIDAHAAQLAGSPAFDVPGLGTFRVHAKKDRKEWDKERLLADVLDSRIVSADGEVADETPLEKVTMVWNLGAPRTKALTARGLRADNYCTTVKRGFTVELPAKGTDDEGNDDE